MPDEYKKSERALIHHALQDSLVRIPKTFKQDYLNYQKQNNFKYLLQINILSQISYASYTISDWFILADVQWSSLLLKLSYTLLMTLFTLVLYARQIKIELFDKVLPTSIIGASLIWMFLLNISQSPLSQTYQYASLVFIVLANLCVQVFFRPALFSSALISTVILVGVYFNVDSNLQHFVLFGLIYAPVLAFSLYISWNSTLKSRTLFLQYKLDEFNRQALDQMAFTDVLTGVNNRRSFDRLANIELEQHPEHLTSLLLFDVDHFKKINDTYGHDVGDEVLKQIVSISQHVLRKKDIFARFGGEEFIILLPLTSLEDAFKIAERLRQQISEQSLYLHESVIQFTISIGITAFCAQHVPLYKAIKQADQALYNAKKQGRNQSQMYR